MSRVKTLDEFVKDSSHELQFTGNWFIDAGILGFVNLMEEVYGWDLEELQRRVKEESEIVYYGYFPFAYLFYHSRVRGTFKEITNIGKKISNLKEKRRKKEDELRKLKNTEKSNLNKIKKKISKLNDDILKIEDQIREKNKEIERKQKSLEKEKRDLQEKLNNILRRILDDANNQFNNVENLISNLIINFDLNPPADHRNFFLYNPKKDLFSSFVYLYYLLKEDFEQLLDFASKISKKKAKGLSYEIYPDSTINPFLYSPSEFPNVGYTLPLTVEELEHSLKLNIPVYVLLLSFSNAFQLIMGRNIMFYTDNLEICCAINKRFKIKKERVKDDFKKLFYITWSSILDEFVENKAKFSLENMYLIEIGNIENQKLKAVEYIGLSKLQASILIEDPIREALNVNLQIDTDRRVWILEEFIRNKPLYELISKHVFYCLKEKNGRNISRKASLYALAIDAKIKENNRIELFSDEFFKGYRSLVNEIKDCYSTLNYGAITISQLFNNEEEKRQICYSLVSALKKKNRIAFVNTLLKKFLEKAGTQGVLRLNRLIFENIVSNDDSWENYGLALVIGILSFGGVSSGEESEEV